MRESKALFVLDSILVCHDNEYCLCVIAKQCLCLIVNWFGDFWLCVIVKRRMYIMLSTGSA